MNYPGNHVESGIVTVPTKLRTRKNAPTTHLAYITDKEADVLKKLKKGVPHKGPQGIPNYDSWDYDATTKKSSFTSGAQASAQEARKRGDTSQDRKKNSYQQKDQMSSPRDKAAFRERTGSQVITPSERIARTKNWVTGKDKFLDKPIFVTQDLSYDELSDIATYGEKLKSEEQAKLEAGAKAGKSPEDMGWQSEEWSDWFDQLSGLTSITGDDWADTSKGWYFEGEVDEFGNPVVPGPTTFSGTNYSGGYSDDLLAYYGAELQQGPKQLGDEEFVPGQTPLQEYMVSVNKYNPYTQLAMAKDGGLLSLLR